MKLQDIIDGALGVIEGPLTGQGLDMALGLIPPPWNMIVTAAAHGIPEAVHLVQRLAGGETLTEEQVAAVWPSIQQRAVEVGLNFDAAVAAWKARHPEA